MPTALDLDDRYAGEVRTVRMHVWADDDYRAQNLNWQRVFQRDLDDFDEATAALFGIRFEPEFHDWSRRAAPGAALADGLAELQAVDDGHGAFVVVGLTSALSAVSTNVDYLGFASEPGSYIILRGYATGAERAAFDRSFHDIDAQERDQVLEARRRHQAVTVMLHELGHNLGAPHDDSTPDTIMSPANSIHSAGFPRPTRDVLVGVVDRRLGRATAGGPATTAAGAAMTPATQRHASVVLRVTSAGDVQLGGQTLDLDTVSELLRRSHADDPDTEVVLQRLTGAPTATIDDLVERANAVGLHRVSIAIGDR
jgi:hypothetical protein